MILEMMLYILELATDVTKSTLKTGVALTIYLREDKQCELYTGNTCQLDCFLMATTRKVEVNENTINTLLTPINNYLMLLKS